MIIEKDKISKSASFVLRSSVLEAALSSAGIITSTTLRHVSDRIYFDAYFWPCKPATTYERFYIRAGAVPAAQASIARSHINSVVIPELIAWATSILSLPAGSPIRSSEQVFSREFVGHTPNNSFKPTPLRGAA